MSLDAALEAACAGLGVIAPQRARLVPGRWVRTNTHARNGKGDASVLIFDNWRGGIVWNWQTQDKRRFSIDDSGGVLPEKRKVDLARARARAQIIAERQAQVTAIYDGIVRACVPSRHAYLDRKGFPDELGLVIDDLRPHLPGSDLGKAMERALPKAAGPFLILPGRIGRTVSTVQIISPDGSKKNILGGAVAGAAFRIATGRETWVCEGIATALTVRAALRFLGRSASVLCAFSASNVAKVATLLPGAIIAADHDKPLDQLGGMGTGAFYASRSGCCWLMPPEPGDWNDMHQSHGLRAVALALRDTRPP